MPCSTSWARQKNKLGSRSNWAKLCIKEVMSAMVDGVCLSSYEERVVVNRENWVRQCEVSTQPPEGLLSVKLPSHCRILLNQSLRNTHTRTQTHIYRNTYTYTDTHTRKHVNTHKRIKKWSSWHEFNVFSFIRWCCFYDGHDHVYRHSNMLNILSFMSTCNIAHKILDDPTHILHNEYKLLPSGKRSGAISYKSNLFKQSFLPGDQWLYWIKQGKEGNIHFSN